MEMYYICKCNVNLKLKNELAVEKISRGCDMSKYIYFLMQRENETGLQNTEETKINLILVC